MKNFKKFREGGYYLLHSGSAANSAYFENLKDCRKFLGLFNYYFRNVFHLYDFLLNEEGWFMLVKTKSELEVLTRFREIGGKGDSGNQLPYWRIISELMRLCLSQYVRESNYRHGRTGVKVHSSYKRYYFTSLAEAKSYIRDLRDQILSRGQGRKRYRASKRLYQKLIRLGRGHVLLSSKGIRRRRRLGNEAGRILKHVIDYQFFTNSVLQKMVKATLNKHEKQNPPDF